MIDFAKLLADHEANKHKPQKDYEYRCARCGGDTVFVQKMPESLLRCDKKCASGRRCGGQLVVRRVIRSARTQAQIDALPHGTVVDVTWKDVTAPERYTVEVGEGGATYACCRGWVRRLCIEDVREVVLVDGGEDRGEPV